VVLHPVGPLPASTYWRRRAVLLLALLVVLLLLRSCAGGGGDDHDAAGTPTATPPPTRSAGPSTSPSATPGAADPSRPCSDTELRLVTTTDAATYAVGDSPVLTMTVTNRGTTPCTRDLGSTVVSFQVVSGAARTWSSDDCNAAKGSKPTVLAPGKATQVVQLTWSGKRSRPGCPTPRDQAAAGTYQASGKVGTLSSDRAVFHFR
jgi:hypothetical protein